MNQAAAVWERAVHRGHGSGERRHPPFRGRTQVSRDSSSGVTTI